jgi:hypothetical protein
MIRAKLAISQPTDPEEQEADATADRVMRSHAGIAVGSSACGCADEENCQCSGGAKIARSAAGSAGAAPHGFLGSMRGSTAHPLDHHARAFFEPRFGRDFSHVRVHTDTTAADGARAIDAHAFTAGSDIFFASGRYAPGTSAGMHLLAHELTHVAQGSTIQMPRTDSALPIGSVNDGAEREAGRVSARLMRGQDSGPITAHGAPAIRRFSLRGAWDSIKGAASDTGSWVADKAEAGASAVYHGAKWVGNEAVQGAEAAGKWALGKFQNAWDCLQSLGTGVGNLVSGDVHSLTDLLGIPAPEGEDPSTLDTIVAVLKHPCLQMIPGYGAVSWAAGKLEQAGKFLAGAWHLLQNPQPVIDGIQKAIGKMIAQIPGYVEGLVQTTIKQLGAKAKEHGEGIWRHLKPKLDYLAKNWWQVIKDTGWQLLWPWPSVGKDLKEIWGHVKSAGDNLWNLRFSKALDDILAVERGVNSILGALYGWFFIASVLVGAILGAIFGFGGGALPGAGAGAAFAGEVGEGLLLASVAVEGASILKAGYNLVAQKETQQEKEADYEQIASSTLTLAITGVMFILSEIAVTFAKGLLSRVAGLFRRAGSAESEAAAGLGRGAKGDIPETGPKTETGGADKAPDSTLPPDETGPLATDDLPQLEQEVHNPGKVHPPDDPQLAAKFDAEVEVGDHTYRRSNTDGTWCRFSDPVCGIEIPEIKTDVDTALAPKPETLPPEVAELTPEPNSPEAATTDPVPETTTSGKDLKPGSPEHKAARWKEYQARTGGKGWKYERWSKVYDRNMVRAKIATAAEDAYRKKIGWGESGANQPGVNVEGVERRLDIVDKANLRGVEVKTGDIYLTQEIAWEVLRDKILVEKGWTIEWHFEGHASKPLLKALADAKITVTGVP